MTNGAMKLSKIPNLIRSSRILPIKYLELSVSIEIWKGRTSGSYSHFFIKPNLVIVSRLTSQTDQESAGSGPRQTRTLGRKCAVWASKKLNKSIWTLLDTFKS